MPETQAQPLCAAYIHYLAPGLDDSLGLDAQVRQIQVCAAADGVELVKIYSDRASPADQRKYRPGLVKLLADAKKGRFTRLYVYQMDSFARRLEGRLEMVKELETLGVTLRALVDLSEPQTYRTQCGSLHQRAAGSRSANLPPPLETTPPPFDRLQAGIPLAGQRVPKAGSHQLEAAIQAVSP